MNIGPHVSGCRCWLSPLLWVEFRPAAAQQRERQPELPKPDFANVKYGTRERNVLDLWQAEVDTPAPPVFFQKHFGMLRKRGRATRT